MYYNETINNELIMSSIDSENIDVRVRNPNMHDQDSTSPTRRNQSPSLINNPISSPTNHDANNPQSDSTSSISYSLSKLLKMIHGHIDQLGYNYQKENYKLCVNNEWLLIGVILDKILFFVYCSVVIFATMIIFKY
jgi:hypothetical protein